MDVGFRHPPETPAAKMKRSHGQPPVAKRKTLKDSLKLEGVKVCMLVVFLSFGG
jgi:hypothetical protein